MGDVFISYSRVDAKFVRGLRAVLVNQQRDPWVDWKDVPPTAEWLEEVYAAIHAANDFVFVISPDSCASETCRLEVMHASQNNKRLVPILYRDVQLEDVPAPLAKLNWILFRDNDDPTSAASLLTRALDTDLDWVRAHTRLLVRSIEWADGARDESLLLRGADLEGALAWLTSANESKEPAPTSLQGEYVRMSQVAEAQELERVRGLYARALASQLTAQAQWLEATRPGALPLAMSLAVESMMRSPSPEAEEVLRRCLVQQPKRVARFSHDHRVSVIAFSQTGNVLVTASGEFTEREWYDVEAREKSLEDFVDVRDLNYFLDRGKELRHELIGNVAHVWDPSTGRELTQLEHSASVMTVAISADGTRIASGSADGLSKVWEIPSARLLCSADLGVSPWRGSVYLSPDGGWLLVRGDDHEPRLWVLCTGREVGEPSLSRAIRAAANAEREQLARQRARLDRSIRRHRRAELEKGAAQLGVPVRSDWKKADLVRAIAGELLRPPCVISPDARRVAHRGTTDSDTVTVCDILGSNRVRVAPGGFVSAFAFDPSSRYLCTAAGTEVELWECDAEGTFRLLHCENDVGTLTFSRDGRYLIAAPEKLFPDINKNPELWDIAGGERLEAPAEGELSELFCAARNPWRLAGPDDNLVAERKEPSRTVRVHAHDSRGTGVRLQHKGWVRCTAMGPNDLLATGTDLAAHVWDARQGRELAQLEHPQQVRSVALDVGGEQLATACDDGAARIWDVKTAREKLRVRHTNAVGAVAFSSDAAYLASGGDDNTARLWNIATGKEVARLLHKEPVRAVRFSPDGRTLATGSLDGEVALWVCRPETLIQLVCERMARSLTPAEWEQYLPDEPYRETCASQEAKAEAPVYARNNL